MNQRAPIGLRRRNTGRDQTGFAADLRQLSKMIV